MTGDSQDAPQYAGQVVRRVLLRRNIAIDTETGRALWTYEHRLPATFFVPTAFVGTSHVFPWDNGLPVMANLSWDEVRAMAAMGHEIGSHTMRHEEHQHAEREPIVADMLEGAEAIEGALGVEPRLVTSSTGQVSRYTDAETMDLFLMAYCGKVNKRIVETLQRHGVNAIGLSGLDGRIVQGRRKARIRIVEDGKPRMLDGDFSGSIEEIDSALTTAASPAPARATAG